MSRTIQEGYSFVPVGGVAGTSGSDTLTGTSGVDFLFGKAGADLIFGDAGDDFVQGNEGSDTVYGGAGDDIARGGKGDDFVYGGAGNDVVFGDEGNDFVSGDNGDDILLGRQASDTLSGGAGSDILYGGDGGDSLNGGDGDDDLYGDNGGDTLTGGAGTDLFIIKKEANVTEYITDFNESELVRLSGFAGSAITLYISHTSGDTSVNLGDGQFLVFIGTPQSQVTSSKFLYDGVITISGNSSGISDDSFYFTSLNGDSLNGATGQDSFIASLASDFQSNDTVTGGTGVNSIIVNSGALTMDTATYANVTGVEWFQLNSDAAHVLTFRDAYFSAGTGITGGAVKVTTTATTANLHINGSNLTGTNRIDATGGDGADTLRGGAGADTLTGGAGADSILGGTGADLIYGGDGADTLRGGAGADTLTGGAGADSILGGTGADLIYGGDGADNISGNEGNNSIYGGDGADTITLNNSGSADEFIDAGAGADTLRVWGDEINANDTIYGGAGLDVMRIFSSNLNFAAVNIYGVESFVTSALGGPQSMTFTDAYFSSSGFEGNVVSVSIFSTGSIVSQLNIDGSSLSSANYLSVSGAGTSDTVYGGAGNDIISTFEGNDTLRGGGGADILTGGSGVGSGDTFIYTATSDSTSANRDTITDFDGTTDILRFTGLQTGTFNFIGAHTNAFNGGGLNSEARFNDTTKLLEIDTNGDATVDMEIILTATTLASLSNADFSWT